MGFNGGLMAFDGINNGGLIGFNGSMGSNGM